MYNIYIYMYILYVYIYIIYVYINIYIYIFNDLNNFILIDNFNFYFYSVCTD